MVAYESPRLDATGRSSSPLRPQDAGTADGVPVPLSWPAVRGTGRADGRVAGPDPRTSLDEIPDDMVWEICRRLRLPEWLVLLKCGNREVRRAMRDVLDREGLRAVPEGQGIEVGSEEWYARYSACKGAWRIAAERNSWDNMDFVLLVALDEPEMIRGRLVRPGGTALRAWLHGEGHKVAMATTVRARAGETLRFLFGEVGRDRVDMSHVLRSLAEQGWMDGVEACLTAGRADPNAARNDGATPLLMAAQNGHESVVRALIAKGVDVDATMNDGRTPLLMAAKNGHGAVVGALIAAGATMDAARNDGWTPLLMAAKNGHESVVRALIAKGVDVNAARNDGTTPLLVATRMRHGGVVRALVNAGATMQLHGHGGPVRSVAWSPDGRRVATVSTDNTARIWDATTGEVVRALEGHGDGVTSVAWSPDGRQVATGSGDKTARIWDA